MKNRDCSTLSFGIHRLRDTTGNDQLDSYEFLIRFQGGGEHGPHALVLGPDNMIYVNNGNFVKNPENTSPASPHKNYAEDLLLPLPGTVDTSLSSPTGVKFGTYSQFPAK